MSDGPATEEYARADSSAPSGAMAAASALGSVTSSACSSPPWFGSSLNENNPASHVSSELVYPLRTAPTTAAGRLTNEMTASTSLPSTRASNDACRESPVADNAPAIGVRTPKASGIKTSRLKNVWTTLLTFCAILVGISNSPEAKIGNPMLISGPTRNAFISVLKPVEISPCRICSAASPNWPHNPSSLLKLR